MDKAATGDPVVVDSISRMRRLCLMLGFLPPLAAQMRESIERFVADRQALETGYFGMLPKGRLTALLTETNATLEQVDFAALDRTGRIDWLLLHNHLAAESARAQRSDRARAEIAHLVPFAATIESLAAQSRRGTRPGVGRKQSRSPAPSAEWRTSRTARSATATSAGRF